MAGNITGARIGHGTLLGFGDGASTGETFTNVVERTAIAGPSMSRDTPDASNMDTPNGWREFIGGLKDGGEMSLEANWLPQHASQNLAAGNGQ